LKTPAGCEERTRLLQAYNDATREFSDRVSALNARIGVTPKHEYDLLERASEDARLNRNKRVSPTSGMSPIMGADLSPQMGPVDDQASTTH